MVLGWANMSGVTSMREIWIGKLRNNGIGNKDALVRRAKGSRWMNTLEKLSDGLVTELEGWYGMNAGFPALKSPKYLLNQSSVDFSLDFIAALPSVGAFFDIDGLYDAGLSSEDMSLKRLYCREDTQNLLTASNTMKRGIKIFGSSRSRKVYHYLVLGVLSGQELCKDSFMGTCIKLGSSMYISLSPEGGSHLGFSHAGDIPDYIMTTKADIVVIDGITDLFEHRQLASFVLDHSSKRQAIMVASLAVKTNIEDDEYKGISLLKSYPWTLEEYRSALADMQCFESVKTFLVDDLKIALDDEELENIVLNKFYHAGCSARWMFGKRLNTVTSELQNPSFTGWVVEMDFINQITSCKGGSVNLRNEDWIVTDYIECDMDSDSIEQVSNRIVPGCWLIPKNGIKEGMILRVCWM